MLVLNCDASFLRRSAGALTLVAAATIVLGVAGCGYAMDQTTTSVEPLDQTTASTVSTAPSSATTQPAAIKEIAVSAPDLSSQPEEIIRVRWGTGPGEVSNGEGDFGPSGPDLMAVSPDGKSVAVYDAYADLPRVNLYADGAPAGAVTLKDPPMAIAITDRREVYALHQARPTSTIVHLAPSGEVLETILLDGALDPADLLWAGTDLYVLAGVGGTDADGYLPVVKDGSPVVWDDMSSALPAIEQEYPLSPGHAVLTRDPAGGFLLTVSREDASSTAAHLTLPIELAQAAGFLDGSAFNGLPVVVLFSSPPEGGPSVGCFVAVDAIRGEAKMATVQFDWKMPGGDAYVGMDAIYVMRLDFDKGMQLLRVPFE